MPVKKEEEKKLTPKKRTPKTTAKSEKEKVEVNQVFKWVCYEKWWTN